MATGKFKSAAMYGITRTMGNRDGPGWIVALMRNGVRLSKPFPFSIFGGEEAALIRAEAWRDDVAKKHPPASRQQRATQLRSTNKTGIPGVTCLFGPDGEPRSWVARTQISPDKKLHAKFSIRRYGLDAKLLAIAARQKQLQHLTGLAFVHPSETVVREAPLDLFRLMFRHPLPGSRSSGGPTKAASLACNTSSPKSSIRGTGAPARSWMARSSRSTSPSRRTPSASAVLRTTEVIRVTQTSVMQRNAPARSRAF